MNTAEIIQKTYVEYLPDGTKEIDTEKNSSNKYNQQATTIAKNENTTQELEKKKIKEKTKTEQLKETQLYTQETQQTSNTKNIGK